MGDFDKIIKENIEALFMPLLDKLLGIRIKTAEDVGEKFQSTIEREPDFLKHVVDMDGAEFLLQLEFQTNNEQGMVYRMAEYKAILQRKFALPVRQFVIYLGMSEPTMITELPEEQQITGFTLRNVHDLSVEQVIHSEVPEEIVLSILTDFPPEEAESVVKQILINLKRVAKDEATLKRYIQQLLVLSRLRKLEEKTNLEVKTMPITYDITKDALYREGRAEGKEEGLLEVAKRMIEKGYAVDQVASLTGISPIEIKRLKKS